MYAWFIYGCRFVTLSCDQNEVVIYLALQSLLLLANFRDSKDFFSFPTFHFNGLIIVYRWCDTYVYQQTHARNQIFDMHELMS